MTIPRTKLTVTMKDKAVPSVIGGIINGVIKRREDTIETMIETIETQAMKEKEMIQDMTHARIYPDRITVPADRFNVGFGTLMVGEQI